MDTITLYRPVGIKELELIAASGWRAFPPRLNWQPIFYPVLNEAYAIQIAGEWNAHDAFSGYCGVVTRFEMLRDYMAIYPTQNVGGALHEELWIPAGDLQDFNKQIAGNIAVTCAFFGTGFVMPDNATIAGLLEKYYRK